MPRRKAKTEAGRVGTKSRDMRWRDSAGEVWASKHECDVYAFLAAAGASPRRATRERDAVAYTTHVRGGVCLGCRAKTVAQEHTYTPDIHVSAGLPGLVASGSSVEAKGYLRASDRRVLRGVMAAKPDLNLCLVLQRYHADTVKWARKFLKIPVLVLTKNGLETCH